MNQELRRFLKEHRETDGMIESLLDEDLLNNVPQKSGVYIFISEEQKFIYPEGESPVIYIGKSDNLQRRIKQHFKESKDIKKLTKPEAADQWYYPRYQYIRKFGCKVFWFTTRGLQDSKDLECNILARFYEKFYATPVGNGAFSFGK